MKAKQEFRAAREAATVAVFASTVEAAQALGSAMTALRLAGEKCHAAFTNMGDALEATRPMLRKRRARRKAKARAKK